MITVADGYNGHTIDLDVTKIVKFDDNLVCLRVVGSDYLISWVRVSQLEKAGYKLVNGKIVPK